jgi:hypothetical protein
MARWWSYVARGRLSNIASTNKPKTATTTKSVAALVMSNSVQNMDNPLTKSDEGA